MELLLIKFSLYGLTFRNMYQSLLDFNRLFKVFTSIISSEYDFNDDEQIEESDNSNSDTC